MRLFLSLVAGLALFAFAPGGAWQEARADADSIIGSWRGTGIARPKDGEPEKVSCRVSYTAGSGRTYVLNASCATTGGTFQQSGRVVALGGNRYTGRIYNSQYDATGSVSVRVNGDRQTVTVSSSKGSANVTLRRQ